MMVERWNARISPKDNVYLLGDVFFKMKLRDAQAIRSKLAGNIHLIRGNHDETACSMSNAWAWVKDIYELSFPEFHAVLCHYPLRSWPGALRGSLNLHGHCHGTLKPSLPRQVDLGVDVHNFYPVSLEEVKAIVNRPLNWEDPPLPEELNDLIRHMWRNDGFTQNGYMTMSTRQKWMYELITKRSQRQES